MHHRESESEMGKISGHFSKAMQEAAKAAAASTAEAAKAAAASTARQNARTQQALQQAATNIAQAAAMGGPKSKGHSVQGKGRSVQGKSAPKLMGAAKQVMMMLPRHAAASTSSQAVLGRACALFLTVTFS